MKKLSESHLQILEKNEICCEDVASVLGDLVDDDLTPTLKERIAGHIHGCEFCKRSEESYRWVVEAARELRNEEPVIPTDVQNRLRSALNKKLGLNLAPVTGEQVQ